MLDINMLRPHVLEGLASGQLKLLELVELVQDSVREELTHLSTPAEVTNCSRLAGNEHNGLEVLKQVNASKVTMAEHRRFTEEQLDLVLARQYTNIGLSLTWAFHTLRRKGLKARLESKG